jgi:hypothetical protein
MHVRQQNNVKKGKKYVICKMCPAPEVLVIEVIDKVQQYFKLA